MEKVFLFFKMAACSEQDVNSKQAHTEICSLDLSSCRGHCDKGNRAFDSDEVSKKALSKGKESDSVDLKKLSDDQFLNLLEEASDFKKCPKEESGFLQQLKKQTSEFGISQNVKICLHDQQSPELICKDKQSCFSSAVEVKSISTTSKNVIHEHFRAEGSVGILGIQKKSKQGTVNIDSMRNAGIGRGKQRIKDLSHSYSFTPTDERSEQSARKIESYKTPFTTKHNWSPVKYTTFRKKENTHESPLTCRKDKIVSSTQDINCKYTGSSSIYAVGNNTHNSQKCIRHSVAESPSGLRNSVCDTKIRGTKCSTNCSFPVTTISQPNGAHSMHQDICTKDVSCTEMDCYKELGSRKQCDNQEQNDRGCQRRIRPVRINPSHEATSIQLTKCKDLEVKTQVDKKLPLMHKNQVGIKDQETSGTYSGCEGRNIQSCLYSSCANAAEELATSKLSHDSIKVGSSYESKKDASQFDVNGNFTSENCTVSQNCSNTILSSNSFISGNSALDDEQSPKSDAVLSKSKRIRNSVEHTVYSENTFGHQGVEDISKLVHYILSDDKKNSSFNTGSATVVNSFPKKILTDNKPLLPQEIDKSKAFFKEIKNNPHCQRGINVSSYEQIPNKETVHCFDLESSSIKDSVKQNIPLVPDKLGVERILDWSVSSEYETKECVATSSEELEQCANCSNSDFVESEVSSFVRDFYAVTDIEHPLEEEEFRVVKRQRKRHQQKRSDLIKCHVHALSTERELSSQNQACNSVDAMMLFPALPPAHRSQRGKLDSSRRKSTCSMPPSEHSSADSSDLESVHSLPVGTSVNYPVSTLPHSASVTSSPSAPQASYADVIRMPAPVVGKVLPHQGFSSPVGENSKSTEQRCSQYMDNNAVLEKLQRKDDIIQPSGSSEWIISRLSQLDVNSSGNTLNINGVSPHSTQNGQDFVNPRPIVVSLEKPSFYNSSLQASKNTASSFIHPANFHSPDKKNGENGGLIDCACSLEKAKDKTNEKQISFFSTSVQGSSPLELSNQLMDSATNERTDSVYSSPHSISSSICDAFKIASSSTSNEQKLNAKTKLPAVIIMDNCLPSENMTGISFGIDFEELIRLSADCVMSAGTVKEASGSAIQEDSACVSTDQNSKEYTESQPKTVNSKTEELESSLPSESLSKNVKLDGSGATSLLSVAGKDLCWRDLEVDTRTCNYSHIVGFLSEAWCGVLKDYDKDSPGSGDVKIKYYSEL